MTTMQQQETLNSIAPLQIALVGNPNAGKTTLFNTLTGLRQRIGNYPGVTVSMSTGTVFLDQKPAYITDLPGTYSLAASSPDEKIVHDYIHGNVPNAAKPDVLVCVIDATQLSKNLFLASQLAEHRIPMVIALSFWDSASRQRTQFQLKLLSTRLHVPVIPVNAAKNIGISELKIAIQQVAATRQTPTRIRWEPKIAAALQECGLALEEAGHPCTDAEIQRLVFDSTPVTRKIAAKGSEKVHHAIDLCRSQIRLAGYHPHTVEAVAHHRHLAALLEGVIQSDRPQTRRSGESIDRILTHKVWGMTLFFVFMYLIFQSVYSWSVPFMDLIDSGKEWLQGVVESQLEAYPRFQSLVADGIIEGVGAFVIFLPQILVLFFFIGLLEETGYMARAAFIMDRAFSWTGLNGKSFVPLLSSFACAIPGILATRTIEDRRARIITIMIAPLMSCSARLPVYVLIIGALIEPRYGGFIAGLTLFAMHFVGVIVAIPTAAFLNMLLKRTKPRPFLIELPDYQIPKLHNLFWRMWSEGREFIIRAGTIIFAITVIVWALLYFPRPEELPSIVTDSFVETAVADGWDRAELIEALKDDTSDLSQQLEREIDAAFVNHSYLSRFGKAVQPVFGWAGFDWRLSVGILASFPAREVIVSTLGVMMSLGGDIDEDDPSLRGAIRDARWTDGPRMGEPLFTLPVAFAVLVFFALCQQCGATLAVIRSEASSGWAVLSFVFMTLLAWIASVVVYQTTTFLFY